MSACAIQADTRDMLRQMALPLITERRVKGALSVVSRDTGLPFSKVRRLYYGITDHVLALEWHAISNAYSAWLLKQEQKLEADIEELRAKRTARMQGRLDLGRETNAAAAVEVAVDTASKAD